MEYVRLGKTDLIVSRVAFGAMRLTDSVGVDDAASIVRKAYDCGINFLIPQAKALKASAFLEMLFTTLEKMFFCQPQRAEKLLQK